MNLSKFYLFRCLFVFGLAGHTLQLFGDECDLGQNTLITKLIEQMPATGANFGSYKIAVSGNTLIAGAPAEYGGDYNANFPHADVFVLQGTNWTLQTILSEPGIVYEPYSHADFDIHDYKFGSSVAIDGDTAVVGAGGDRSNSEEATGSAWVYVRQGTNWARQAELTAGEFARSFDLFGYSVGIQGDVIVVGASRTGTSTNLPSVYVFTRNGTNWLRTQILQPLDPSLTSAFGTSVSINGNMIVVGAYTAAAGSVPLAGAVYTFSYDGTNWNQQQKINAVVPQTSGSFGLSTLLTDKILFVADFSNDTVNAYPRAGNMLGVPTVISGGQSGENFGSGMAFANNILAVGANYYGGGTNNHQGAVYLYENLCTNWSLVNQIIASDGSPGDEFGFALAFEATTLLSSARFAAVNSVQAAGAIYAYNICDDVPTTSIALYPGITISGVSGHTYGIQYTTNLIAPTNWINITNVTLNAPTQIWYDSEPATQPQRYYHIVPGPICLP